MSGKLPFSVSTLLATALLGAQELPPPIPGEEAPRAIPVNPPAAPKAVPVTPATPSEGPKVKHQKNKELRAVQIPLGIRDAKPIVPKTEELMRASEKGIVDGDTMWMTIDHARSQGVTTVDLGRDGLCFLIERKVVDGKVAPLVVRGGKGIPANVREAILQQARKKAVLFGLGRDRLLVGSGSQRMRLGVSARYGRSVHSSQSILFDEFPAEVRKAATDLLEAARILPVASIAKGVVSAEFVPPQQARRLTILSGRRLIAVRDPGKAATVLHPAVAAARMPGRSVVVLDELQWEQIQGYLTAGGTDPAAATGPDRGTGQCLIAVGAQTYRLTVSPVGW